MGAGCLTIASTADLDRLRAGLVPERIALRVPGKPAIEQALREDRLARALTACGCGVTARFALAGLAFAPLLFLTGWLDGVGAIATALAVLAFVLPFAVAGAVAGDLSSRRARQREIDALARWIGGS